MKWPALPIEKVMIYTAVYGGYEARVTDLPGDIDAPAFVFTDDVDLQVGRGWQVILAEPDDHIQPNPANGDPLITLPMLRHKWWKCHPNMAAYFAGVRHSARYDVASIWLDANMSVTVGQFVKRNLDALGGDDWSMVRHPWRDCALDEGVYSSTLPRYDRAALLRQVAHYRDEWKHPEHWGLMATGHCVRRHSVATFALGAEWWHHNLTWSHQDQVSLPVLMHAAAEPWATNGNGAMLKPLRINYDLPWSKWWELRAHGS